MASNVRVTTYISWHEALKAAEMIEDDNDGGAFCLQDAKRLRLLADRIEKKLAEEDSQHE